MYTSSKLPPTISHYKNFNGVVQKVQQVSNRDGEKPSPVNLSIREATPIELPPLNWVNYQAIPSSVVVRNSGFTVVVNATYDEEPPYVNSGPLVGNYIFSQVHFHWGEHNNTGSSHAVDGVRYPLEMHVIHLRNDCENLGDAFLKKGCIAVMVHLFSLREERNTQMDQLTAILQFIRKPKCCARLYPTPLTEIVQPFTSDYFTYWGAVGSRRGQYRILWLVSRSVLPVSAQQLEEFRHICDPEGKALVSNSSKPQPLLGRSLFLVSPSEKTNETIYGVSQRQTKTIMSSESQESIDIENAEYKSLADLDELNDDDEDVDGSYIGSHCRICPPPKRLKHVANINVGYPYKLNEGDTSIEESCIDLDMKESGVTVQTEMKYKDDRRGQRLVTNVNVTTGRQQKYKTRYPVEAVYSVLSARGSELHLRRKQTVVRPSEPSTEQACVFLGGQSSTHHTRSAPSLTGNNAFLTNKQEHTDLSNTPMKNMSSELRVFNIESDTEMSKDKKGLQKVLDPKLPRFGTTGGVYNYEETSFKEENLKRSKNVKKVVFQEFETPRQTGGISYPEHDSATIYKKTPKTNGALEVKKHENDLFFGQPSRTKNGHNNFYSEEYQDTMTEEEHSKYLRTKQNKFVNVLTEEPKDNKISFNDDQSLIGNNNTVLKKQYQDKSLREEMPVDFNSYTSKLKNNDSAAKENLTLQNKENLNNQPFQVSNKGERCNKTEQKQETQKNKHFKAINGETSQQQAEENDEKETNSRFPEKKNDVVLLSKKQEKHSNPYYKVSLVVRTRVSDHRNLGKNGKSGQEYYVTKILPKDTRIYVTPKTSTSYVQNREEPQELYYAKPVLEDDQVYLENLNEATVEPREGKPNGPQSDKPEMYYNEEVAENEESEFSHHQRKYTSFKKNQTSKSQSINQDNVGNQLLATENTNKNVNKSENMIDYKEPVQISNVQESLEINEEINRKETSEFNHKENNKTNLSVLSPKTKASKINLNNTLTPIENKSTGINKAGNASTLLKSQEKELNENLVQKTNVYHRRNEPEEDVYIADKIITGKVGKSHSTDVLVRRKVTEILNPQKTDLSKEVDYNLARSKHPEDQYFKKEPSTVIHQKLSLDQKIQGHSQIRQTVEYHDEKRSKPDDRNIDSSKPVAESQINPQKPNNTFTGMTKAYEESSHEQSSTIKKTQLHSYRPVQPNSLQNTSPHTIDPEPLQKQINDHDQNQRHIEDIQTDQKAKEQVTEHKSKNQVNVIDSKLVEQQSNKNNNKLTNLSEVYEESNLEQSSTIKKSHQQTIKHFKQGQNNFQNLIDTKSFEKERLDNVDDSENTINKEKNNILKEENSDIKLVIPSAHLNIDMVKSSFSGPSNSKKSLKGSKEPAQSGNFNLSHEFGVTSSINQKQTHSQHEKIITQNDIIQENDQADKIKSQLLTKVLSETLEENATEKIEDEQNTLLTVQTSKTLINKKKDPLQKNETADIDYTETLEESESVYTTKKITEKSRTIQKKGEVSYKLPKQSLNRNNESDSNYVVEIKKVEIPDPHYITRVPKQPLVEYEAYPVDPQQPFEIIMETSEEVSSVVKTNKTYMMFKKINGKAVMNQPSVIEPMRLQKSKDSFPYSDSKISRETNDENQQIKSNEKQKPETAKKILEDYKLSDSNNLQNQIVLQNKNKIQEKSPKINYNNDGLFTHYEYSETSLVSERKVMIKEKKYKQTIQQNFVEEKGKKSLPEVKKQPLETVEELQDSKPKTSSIFSVQRSDSKKDDTENKTKIVVGSYQKIKHDSPPSITPSDLQPNKSVERIREKYPIPTRNGAETSRAIQNFGEEYFESSSIKEQKYQSSKKHFISVKGGPGLVSNNRAQPISFGLNHSDTPFPVLLQPQNTPNAVEDSKYPEMYDKPTKDTPVKEPSSNSKVEEISETSSEQQRMSKHNKSNTNDNRREKPSLSLTQNTSNKVGPISETDGNIVIYIRQPKSKKKEHIAPKITVDVSGSQHLTPSDLSAQQVKVHEMKKEKGKKNNELKKVTKVRKSKSADDYRVSISTVSSTEESDKTISSESNEEQIIDTTHYNLTLKSETKVELENGRAANVKSKAEVKIKPLENQPGPSGVSEKTKNKKQEQISTTMSAARQQSSYSDTHSSSSFEEPTISNFSGFNQSPIRIDSQFSEVKNFPKIQFFNHWDVEGDALLENNGKTLRGTYITDSSLPYIQGGPLSDIYVFSELHFHWGHKDCCGAEHVIDGQRHTLEAHFLYFKREYGILKEALKHTDGLAVIAVNLNVGGPPNPQFGEMVKDIHLLSEPDTGTYIPAHTLFSWMKPVISNSRGYFSYKGALTTDPPHVEAVTWMIFPEPIIFCCQQSREFRKLKSNKGELLTKTYRPPQPLNNRPVYFVPLNV